MDVFSTIILSTIIVFTIGLAILYIYERGWKAGYAQGKNAKPYKIFTDGWGIVLPDNQGTIKLVREQEDINGH